MLTNSFCKKNRISCLNHTQSKSGREIWSKDTEFRPIEVIIKNELLHHDTVLFSVSQYNVKQHAVILHIVQQPNQDTIVLKSPKITEINHN